MDLGINKCYGGIPPGNWQTFLSQSGLPRRVQPLWLRLFDRLGKVLFAITTGFVLILETAVHGTDHLYALLLCGGVGFVVATLLNAGIKFLFKKKRPVGEVKRTKNLLTPLMQYSFPSYHVQLGFTMTFIACWFLFQIHWALVLPFVLGPKR